MSIPPLNHSFSSRRTFAKNAHYAATREERMIRKEQRLHEQFAHLSEKNDSFLARMIAFLGGNQPQQKPDTAVMPSYSGIGFATELCRRIMDGTR